MKLILFIVALIYSSLMIFAMSIPEFILNDRYYLDVPDNKLNDEIPFTIGNKVLIENQEDGKSLVLQRLNPYYEMDRDNPPVREGVVWAKIAGWKDPLEDFNVVTSLIFCPDGTHVLAALLHPEYYFTEPNNYIFEMKKYGDFKHATLYTLDFKFEFNGKTFNQNWLIWLGNDANALCCDSDFSKSVELFSYTPYGYGFPEDVLERQRELIGDMATKYTEEQIENLRHEMTLYRPASLSYDRRLAVYVDPNKYEKFEEEVEEMRAERRTYEYMAKIANRGRLQRYTLPVWLAAIDSEWNAQAPLIENLADELPRTEEELKDYVAWITRGFRPFFDYEVAIDMHMTPIKFELTEEGILATSAGEDREFGTEDDQSFLSEYANRFVDKWNGSPKTLSF